MKVATERQAVCMKSVYDVKSWKYLKILFCKLRATKISTARISETRVRKLNFYGICSMQTFVRN
jgi:hypothetical protein